MSLKNFRYHTKIENEHVLEGKGVLLPLMKDPVDRLIEVVI